MQHAANPVAVIVKGFPRLSNTFVAQELAALERCGLPFRIYSLRPPDAAAASAGEMGITSPVVYLPPFLYGQPGRVLRSWRKVRRMAGYAAARRAWLADLGRDPAPARLLWFGLAGVLAAELPDDIGLLYAHFLDGPGSVARYAALMTGKPWCCFAHADLWAMPVWEKREKLAEAEWIATCTAVGRDHLAALTTDPDKVELAYHGVDTDRLPAAPPRRPARDGADEHDPVRILSVGRAVEKKGYDVVIEALASLPDDLAWRFEHIGGGPRLRRLKARASALGLAGRVAWLGARPRAEVFEKCRTADLFVLACRVAGNGRRDGLPNVLMEAQSQGLACVSTTVSAIPELILDRRTGRLVPPDDPAALARALERLIRNPQERTRMGTAAAERLRRHFDMRVGIGRLATRFALPAAATPEREEYEPLRSSGERL